MAEAAFRQPEDRERAGKSSLVVFSSRGWRKNVCVRARARALHPGRELDSWIPCFWSGGAETPSTCWSMCWSENSELNDPSVLASPAPRTPPTPKNPGHAPTHACPGRPACLPARHRHCSRHGGAVRLGRRLGPDGRGDTAEATQLQRPQALVHATERWSRAAQHRGGRG